MASASEFIDNSNLVLNKDDLRRIDAMSRGKRFLGMYKGPLPGQEDETLYGHRWRPGATTVTS